MPFRGRCCYGDGRTLQYNRPSSGACNLTGDADSFSHDIVIVPPIMVIAIVVIPIIILASSSRVGSGGKNIKNL